MDILVNYADVTYRKAQKLNTKMAYLLGRFDKVYEYSPDNIDKSFKEANSYYFTTGNPRIGKYGLWRPYIISDAIKRSNNGDYICYCDSGAFFIRKFKHLKAFMVQEGLDLLCFDQPFLEYQWTKRDVFTYLQCDDDEYAKTNQRLSGYFCFVVNERTKQFFDEFLKIAYDAPYLFSDSDNVGTKGNYEGFIENRHNQSVFSLLTKKYGIRSYRDISEIGIKPEMYSHVPNAVFSPVPHPESNYPQMVILHRMGKFKLKSFIFLVMRLLLPVETYYKIIDWIDRWNR